MAQVSQFRIDVRSAHPDALPLVLTHGWPGSFVGFMTVIGPLPAPDDAHDAFDVVCPSLPGYGFSGKPRETGWGIERIARAWAGARRSYLCLRRELVSSRAPPTRRSRPTSTPARRRRRRSPRPVPPAATCRLPGRVIRVSYNLPRVTYVLLCFVADDMTGLAHAIMGMHLVIHRG